MSIIQKLQSILWKSFSDEFVAFHLPQSRTNGLLCTQVSFLHQSETVFIQLMKSMLILWKPFLPGAIHVGSERDGDDKWVIRRVTKQRRTLGS
jgi:hypothetical protein